MEKIIIKFPFQDRILKEIAFLNPQNRQLTSVMGIVNLASRFTSFSTDKMDELMMEFRDYRGATDGQLPTLLSEPLENTGSEATCGLENFWAAMSELKSITDSALLRFGTLSHLAKILLVLPHSNADPERLFSMVRKIDTEQRRCLDPSTVCELVMTTSFCYLTNS